MTFELRRYVAATDTMSRTGECIAYRPLIVERGTSGECTDSLQMLSLEFFWPSFSCIFVYVAANRLALLTKQYSDILSLYNSLIKCTVYTQVLYISYGLSRLYVRITSFTLKISVQFFLKQYVGVKSKCRGNSSGRFRRGTCGQSDILFILLVSEGQM